MAKNSGAASDQTDQSQETAEQKAAREAAEAQAKADEEAKAKSAAKAVVASLCHKTIYPTYGRAGIRMTRQPQDYRVTAEQLAALKADPWVVVAEK